MFAAAAAVLVAGAAGEVLGDDAGVGVAPGAPGDVGGGAEEGDDWFFEGAGEVKGKGIDTDEELRLIDEGSEFFERDFAAEVEDVEALADGAGHGELGRIGASGEEEAFALGEEMLGEGAHFGDGPTLEAPAGGGVDEDEGGWLEGGLTGSWRDVEEELAVFPGGEEVDAAQGIEVSLDGVAEGRAVFHEVSIKSFLQLSLWLEADAAGGARDFSGDGPPVSLGEIDHEVVFTPPDGGEDAPLLREARQPLLVADETGDGRVSLQHRDRFGVEISVDFGPGEGPFQGGEYRCREEDVPQMAVFDNQNFFHSL